jgi:hypothetical protein
MPVVAEVRHKKRNGPESFSTVSSGTSSIFGHDVGGVD